MKILVTGGDGFIGKHLIEELKENNEILNLDVKQGYDLTDFDRINEKIKRFNPDIIFHLASLFKGQKEELFKVNVDATKNLLGNTNFKKFIFLSTSELYYGNSPPFKEDMPISYRSLYSQTKLFAEELCKEKIKQNKNIIIIRPSVVYGSGQNNKMFIPSLIDAILNKNEFNMTEGEQMRDFIFIEDLVRLLKRLIFEPKVNGQIINAGSGNSKKLKEVAKLVKVITSSNIKINFGALPYRENEIMQHSYDISKANQLLNWEPLINLEEGLRRTIDNLIQEN